MTPLTSTLRLQSHALTIDLSRHQLVHLSTTRLAVRGQQLSLRNLRGARVSTQPKGKQRPRSSQHTIAIVPYNPCSPIISRIERRRAMMDAPTTPPKTRNHSIDVKWDEDDNSVDEVPDFHFDWGVGGKSREKEKSFEAFATPPVNGRVVSLQQSANTSLSSSVGSSKAFPRSEISARSAATSLPTPPDDFRTSLGRRAAHEDEEHTSSGSRSRSSRVVSEPLLLGGTSGHSVRSRWIALLNRTDLSLCSCKGLVKMVGRRRA